MALDSELDAARNWYMLLRASIVEIADPEFQARVWMGNLPEPRSSYVEVGATILDDTPFELIASHLDELGIDPRTWNDVVEFCSALRTFDDGISDPYDVGAVITNPAWVSITLRARALLEKLPKC